MNSSDIKNALFDGAKKPEDANKQRDTESDRRIVDNALDEAENGSLDGINDIFFASVKKIREISEPKFLQIKARYGKIKGLLASDLNKQTKAYRQKSKKTEGDDSTSGRTSKADMLSELIRQESTLFHNDDKEAYVHCCINNQPNEEGESTGVHYEVWALKSEGFKDYAGFKYFEAYDAGVGDSAMKEAIDNLSADAKYSGVKHEVYLRYALHNEIVYIDLCNDQWQVIVIDESGWKIAENKDIPVKFTRASHMRPIPAPERGGSIDQLWNAFTIKDQDTKHMLCAWMMDAMLTDTDYLMLEVGGEAGSAKSMMQERIKSLLDPSKGNLLVYSGKLDDLPVIALHTYMVSYENMSHLSKQMQDKFCSMCTGAATATRTLHSTHDISIWGVKRPIIINGIVDLATREDMLQRTVCVELPRIEKNRSKKELREEWEQQQSQILGALYDLLSKILYQRKVIKIPYSEDTRQLDFITNGQAMFNALEVDDSFPELFNRSSLNVIERSLNHSPVSLALVRLIDNEHSFAGSMTELLTSLSNKYRPDYYDTKAWPKSPEGLNSTLKRQYSPLRKRGIQIKKERCSYKRIIVIDKITDKPSSHDKTTIVL